MTTKNETHFPLSLASKFHHKLPTFPEKNTGNSSASPWVACMMSPKSGGIAGAEILLNRRGIGRGDETTLQGINISHLGKRKIIFKMPFLGGYVSSLEGILDLKKMFPKKLL